MDIEKSGYFWFYRRGRIGLELGRLDWRRRRRRRRSNKLKGWGGDLRKRGIVFITCSAV